MKYLKVFETENLQNAFRESEDYLQPHVSCTSDRRNIKYNIYSKEEWKLTRIPFTIKALGSGTLTWALENKTVTYSKNKGEYQTWDGVNGISLEEGDTVAFIANNDNYNENIISCTANYEVLGNLYSIISSDFLNEQSFTEAVFRRLFYGSQTLLYADKLILSRIQTSKACYQGTFRDCVNLKTAPKLPALNAAQTCYNTMFMGCSSLTKAPELPATTLDTSCYNSMFCDCTSLVKAPKILPAKNVPLRAYKTMFSETAITKAPKIAATTLGEESCVAMFQDCLNLKTGVKDFSPTVVNYQSCYAMFVRCYSLEETPEILPATTVAEQCYMNMFQNCYKIITGPELPAVTLASECYRGMFVGCSGLTTPPTLPATGLANSCYIYMFNNCTSLTHAPDLLAETLVSKCYERMFEGCSNLSYIKCLAHTQLSSTYSKDWVKNISPTGTFVQWCCISSLSPDNNTFPENWTLTCEGVCE